MVRGEEGPAVPKGLLWGHVGTMSRQERGQRGWTGAPGVSGNLVEVRGRDAETTDGGPGVVGEGSQATCSVWQGRECVT